MENISVLSGDGLATYQLWQIGVCQIESLIMAFILFIELFQKNAK